MALLSVLAARKSAIVKFIRDTSPSVQPAALPTSQTKFSDIDWEISRFAREASDTLLHIRRWRITITPEDRCAREYFMNGELRDVSHRARLIFPHSSYLMLIEPAEHRVGPEEFDRRLSQSV